MTAAGHADQECDRSVGASLLDVQLLQGGAGRPQIDGGSLDRRQERDGGCSLQQFDDVPVSVGFSHKRDTQSAGVARLGSAEPMARESTVYRVRFNAIPHGCPIWSAYSTSCPPRQRR